MMETKSGRGGARAGAGRKHGGKNRKTLERKTQREAAMARFAVDGELPTTAREMDVLVVACLADVAKHGTRVNDRLRAAKALLRYADMKEKRGGR